MLPEPGSIQQLNNLLHMMVAVRASPVSSKTKLRRCPTFKIDLFLARHSAPRRARSAAGTGLSNLWVLTFPPRSALTYLPDFILLQSTSRWQLNLLHIQLFTFTNHPVQGSKAAL
jgi:hypothetical protein